MQVLFEIKISPFIAIIKIKNINARESIEDVQKLVALEKTISFAL
jgi:hypothetical protein